MTRQVFLKANGRDLAILETGTKPQLRGIAQSDRNSIPYIGTRKAPAPKRR